LITLCFMKMREYTWFCIDIFCTILQISLTCICIINSDLHKYITTYLYVQAFNLSYVYIFTYDLPILTMISLHLLTSVSLISRSAYTLMTSWYHNLDIRLDTLYWSGLENNSPKIEKMIEISTIINFVLRVICVPFYRLKHLHYFKETIYVYIYICIYIYIYVYTYIYMYKQR
jgi:hypothetical protein